MGVAPVVGARFHALTTPAQQDRTLHRLVHVAHRDVGRRAREHDAALVAALRAHQVGLREVVDHLGEPRAGDVLRGGDVAGVQHGAGVVTRQLVDGADRVVSLGGELHDVFVHQLEDNVQLLVHGRDAGRPPQRRRPG